MSTRVAQLAGCLIRCFEGLRLEAYQDTGGVWTIGYGHTAFVKAGTTCTAEQAEDWLEQDAAPLFDTAAHYGTLASLTDTDSPVKRSVPATAALISFGYNLGLVPLQHVLEEVADITAFVHDRHGNVLPGLVARRALEAALINLP